MQSQKQMSIIQSKSFCWIVQKKNENKSNERSFWFLLSSIQQKRYESAIIMAFY